MQNIFGQRPHDIRFDWGLSGARALRADITVVVDVLRFSTSVTVAVQRGTIVFPFPWKDERAAGFAAARNAVLEWAGSKRPDSLLARRHRPCRPLDCLRESQFRAAAVLFDTMHDKLAETLRHCVGGRELISKGFGSDVDVAAEHNSSSVVPILTDGAFGTAG